MVGRKRRGHPWRLSDEQRDEIDRRIAAGATQEEVDEAVGCDPRTVTRWITRTGGVRRYERRRSTRFLSLAEREEIAVGVSSVFLTATAPAILAMRGTSEARSRQAH